RRHEDESLVAVPMIGRAHQISVHQRGDHFEGINAQLTTGIGDFLGRLQAEAPSKDREPIEHSLLGAVEKLVAPVDRGDVRLSPFSGASLGANVLPQSITEPAWSSAVNRSRATSWLSLA